MRLKLKNFLLNGVVVLAAIAIAWAIYEPKYLADRAAQVYQVWWKQ